MDLNTPFSVLAWRLKDRMEHVRYFKVFRVSVVERNKNLKNLKRFMYFG
jgi:hypothetical protein